MTIELQPYDPHVTMLRATEDPDTVCLYAIRNTQQCAIHKLPHIKHTSNTLIITRVQSLGHTSVFEHANATFILSNISRGCADQIMRHRMGSFTCSSTHYEPHEYVRFLVSQEEYDTSCEQLLQTYTQMHEHYVAQRAIIGAEARQLLPLATCCNLLWTVNARSLMNFLRLRLCRRNMKEIVMVAERVFMWANEWFPELFTEFASRPECARTVCDQGHMSCNNPW